LRFANQIHLLVLLLSSCLAAQQASSVSGVLRDSSGAAIAQGKVRLKRASIDWIRETICDAQGHYELQDIPPGIYELHAEAAGFSSATKSIAVFAGIASEQDLQLPPARSIEKVEVTGSSADAMNPDPSERTFSPDQLLAANPGRPGAPLSIPGLPIETASGGIKAPQYFAPGVAGDHGEPIAQFFRVGDFLFPNNLPANAHGNGYADPNVLIPNSIASVESDGGAFNVREGNHSVNLGVTYGVTERIPPLLELTADQHDGDLVAAWSPAQSNAWIALEASLGNGFLARPEHRQQYKLNAYRAWRLNAHELNLFGIGYFGSSFVPGLIPTAIPVPGDTINPNQHDTTHNTLLVATDTWRLNDEQHLDLAGFFRTYGLDLRSDFGDGLIRQSEYRTVDGGNITYSLRIGNPLSILAGLDMRRDAPRNLNLDHLAAAGTFQPVTSNDLTLGFVSPFLALDGALTRFFHYDLGVRREEVFLNNVDKLVPNNSFDKLAGITLPKGTFSVLPPHQKVLPKLAFSLGETFHTNDPRIGAPAQTAPSQPTVLVPSHAMQLVISKEIARTDFTATLARVSNAMELAKIDPDTGLQENVGPSLTRSVTLAARRYFSSIFLEASWARATAVNRLTGADIPEAPRLIWDVLGGLDHLPHDIRLRSEYEVVGRKPLGDGFTAVPVRELRVSVLHPFHRGRMEMGLNSVWASGYTGQTLETLQGPGQPGAAEQIVGVPLKSQLSISWKYHSQ
jgi:hypothetical protein